ncbi:MAG: outer membrane protein [Candidatus Midichloriaceae bacterium]|nr:outer membrane protein [Candidatus Midichloriaceae bacterium]
MLTISVSFAVCAAEPKIKRIRYEGNHRISKETIFAYLDVIEGEKATNAKIDSSIKHLFETGFFSDVRISEEGGDLIVRVTENPLINKIGFDGNRKIEESELLQEISMRANSVFSPYKLQSDLNRITSLYQKTGRYSAYIEPKIIKLDQNRVNLIYEINEGREAVIRKINFAGNKNFSDSDLSETIASKEYRFYRFFSNADVYDPDKLEYDKEMLRRFYMNRGYADFKITSTTAELSLNRDGFLITFVIHEGDEYNFGAFKINSNIKGFDSNTLQKLVTIKEGRRFNKENIDESVDAITNYLGEHGYPFVEIDPRVTTNPQEKVATVEFIIRESYKVYIRKINIKNNTRTLDKVIRREMRIAEGDPYNITKVQRSKQRIDNLNYFGKVDFKNKKTDEADKMDIDVEVEETSTGSINFAGGYNTDTGALGQITLSENNFLGKGQQTQLSTSIAQKERNATFSFTEPFFMDKELAAGFDIFANNRDFKSTSSFKSKNVGFALRMGYDITEHLSHGFRYSLKREKVSDVDKDASIYIKEQAGKHVVSLFGHTLAYDKLDNRIAPTEGHLLKLEQDVAGLGWRKEKYSKYFSNRATAAFFYPVYKRDVVFKAVGRAGHILKYGNSKEINLNDRFFIGPDYLRGFRTAGIGPRDNNGNKDALGGDTYYTSTTELIFPIGLPNEVGLKMSAFHDIGTMYGIDNKTFKHNNIINSKNLRASVGMSLIWKSPLGTITLSYAVPYMKQPFDKRERWNLDFGTNF